MVVSVAAHRRHAGQSSAAKERSREHVPFTRIQLVADGLTAAIDRRDDAETERFLALYVAMVVDYANDHLAAARGLFLPTLCSFLLRIDRQRPVPIDAGRQLVDDLIAELESATTLSQLIDAFTTWFRRLLEIGRSPEGAKIVRVEAV
jgi:AraC-like DNA-binding protein